MLVEGQRWIIPLFSHVVTNREALCLLLFQLFYCTPRQGSSPADSCERTTKSDTNDESGNQEESLHSQNLAEV